MKSKVLIFGMLMGVFILGCSSLPLKFTWFSPTSTPSATLTPTITPTSTITSTPMPTATPIPAVRVDNGDHALSIGDWDTALQEFQSALENSSDPLIEAAARLEIGRTHLKAGNFELAVSVLEDLTTANPGSADMPAAAFYLAQAYSGLERYAEAAQEYTRYLELRPGIIDAYILELRGDALFNAGSFGEAARDYAEILNAPSQLDLTTVKMKMARSQVLTGDPTSALGVYDGLLTQAIDDNTKALIQLRKGQIFTELGQIEEANKAFLDGVMNYPTSYDSLPGAAGSGRCWRACK